MKKFKKNLKNKNKKVKPKIINNFLISNFIFFIDINCKK